MTSKRHAKGLEKGKEKEKADMTSKKHAKGGLQKGKQKRKADMTSESHAKGACKTANRHDLERTCKGLAKR